MSDKNFVTLDNLVSSVLLEIGDEGNKRYTLRARQWILDEYRRLNVHLSDFYLERKVELDDVNAGEIPEECVKLLSVGIYRNGEFSPFVKRPDMALLAEDTEDDIWQKENVASPRPDRGFGYWTEDKEHSRFFVRNFILNRAGSAEDTTSNIKDKVVIRFKTNGIDPDGEIFIPYEAKDFIVAAVAYKFVAKGIPVRVTNMALQQNLAQVDAYKEDYLALVYEPANFYEVKDVLFGR